MKLSKRSLQRMELVDSKLVNVVKLAITRTPVDFGVAWMGGLRTTVEQNELFKDGKSKCDGYEILSKHQYGEAVDLISFVNGQAIDNKEMMCIVAGVIFSCAAELGVKIRWGLMWDQSGDIRNNKFDDPFHFELI